MYRDVCLWSCICSPHTLHMCLYCTEKLSHSEILTCMSHTLLKQQIRKILAFYKRVATGVGVYLCTHTCRISLKGSSRHQKPPLSLSVFSVHPPPVPPCSPALRSLLPLAAVVIGYDTGSTGRERGCIWMRLTSSSSLLYSNLVPSSSEPSLSTVTVATSVRPHPLSPLLHPGVISFIKIGRWCPNVCVFLRCIAADLVPSQLPALQHRTESYDSERITRAEKRRHLSQTCYIKSIKYIIAHLGTPQRGSLQLKQPQSRHSEVHTALEKKFTPMFHLMCFVVNVYAFCKFTIKDGKTLFNQAQCLYGLLSIYQVRFSGSSTYWAFCFQKLFSKKKWWFLLKRHHELVWVFRCRCWIYVNALTRSYLYYKIHHITIQGQIFLAKATILWLGCDWLTRLCSDCCVLCFICKTKRQNCKIAFPHHNRWICSSGPDILHFFYS